MNTRTSLGVLATCMHILALGGCKETTPGPKRADHEAVHTPRYHPDVRRGPGGVVQTAPAESAPADEAAVSAVGARGPIGSPILFVNADTLTIPDVLEPIIEELHRQARALSERDYRESVLRLVRNQIDFQVSSMVVYQQARNHFSDKKYQAAFDKEVDQRIKTIINDRFGGIYARYEQHLKALDFTVDDMKERVRRQVMVQEFLRERLRPMLQEPPRRDLVRYYQAHLPEFTTAEKAELFMIEIPLSEELGRSPAGASATQVAEARSRARARLERAREEIESGVPFETVARAYSRGALASEGGAWGEVSRGALAKRWARPGEVVFTLQPGQVSDIIETDEALFIIKCGRRTPAHQTTFEESQRKIVEQLMDDQFSRLRSDYVRDLLNSATIRKDREFLLAVLAAVPRPARAAVE